LKSSNFVKIRTAYAEVCKCIHTLASQS